MKKKKQSLFKKMMENEGFKKKFDEEKRKMRVKKVMEVEIELDYDQIEEIMISDLEWHAKHAEDLEDVEALRRVLHYYKGGDENEL